MAVTPTNTTGKLSALYYPYSRCVNSRALKLFTILYEEVVFVDPLEELFREFLILSDKGCQFVPKQVHERWRDAQEDWDLLCKSGIARIIDPTPILQENDALLSASYASDMADKSFVETAEREAVAAGPWKMLESRVPATVGKSFAEYNTSLAERIHKTNPKTDPHAFSDYQTGVFAWEKYDHHGLREYVIEKLGGRNAEEAGASRLQERTKKRLEESRLDLFEQIYLSGGGTCTDSGQPFGSHPYNYVDSAAYSNGERIRILSFSQGASLAISQCLLLADIEGLIPVTDNALHQELLALKYRRAMSNRSLLDQEALSPLRTSEASARYAILGGNILVQALSPAVLDQLSFKDIIKLRQANQDPLQRFWIKIKAISHELDDVAPGKDLEARINKIIDQSVIPEIQSLQDAIENSKRALFGGLVTKLVTAVPASTAVSVFAGLSGGQILALGAGAGLAAFGISLPALFSHWQEKRTLKKNWLAFIIEMQKAGAAHS